MKLPDSYEALAGQTDATMTTRTGRTWSEWIGFLDERGCESMEHKEIARLVVFWGERLVKLQESLKDLE